MYWTIAVTDWEQKMRFFSEDKQKDLFFEDLLAAGKIVSVIDRRYPLSDVAEL